MRLMELPFLLGLATAPPAMAAEPEVTFMGLGDLAGGEFDSSAVGVSATGLVIVGGGTGASGAQAFRWTLETGMVAIAGPNTSAYAASADGSVVVGSTVGISGPAWRWKDGSIWSLADLTADGSSFAAGVSGDGSVVVGESQADDGCTAVRWTSTEEVACLGLLPRANGGRAYDASADGSVAVGSQPVNRCSQTHCYSYSLAFRWTEESGFTELQDSLGIDSVAYGVSADGSVVVGGRGFAPNTTGFEPYRWTEQVGMVGLGSQFGSGFAYDVSSDGSRIVGSVQAYESDPTAFLWDPTNGMRILQDVLMADYGLDLSGWSLTYASGISDDGTTVVGWGTNPSGSEEAWIAVLPALCADQVDNDGDGLIDFPGDPGCASVTDPFEKDTALLCDDGLDNDEDGFTDFQLGGDEDGDPGCKDPSWLKEDPECQDGINNDLAAGIDFDGGLSVWGVAVDEPDPQCVGTPWSDHEFVPEPNSVALLLTALAAVRLLVRSRSAGTSRAS